MIYGYWRNSIDESSNYPWPTEGKSWDGQEEFLMNLELVQEGARVIAYRGPSMCRVCGKFNGSQEYEVKNIGTWPQGYIHYIRDHNVKPPIEFVELINALVKK